MTLRRPSAWAASTILPIPRKSLTDVAVAAAVPPAEPPDAGGGADGVPQALCSSAAPATDAPTIAAIVRKVRSGSLLVWWCAVSAPTGKSDHDSPASRVHVST